MQARDAYGRSMTKSWDAMTSILLSALALECFVNELDEQIANRVLDDNIAELTASRDITVLLEESKAPLLARIDAYHIALRGGPIDRGRHPLQDIKLLIQLRNALVHRKSERLIFPVSDAGGVVKTHKFVSYFVSRKIIPEPTNMAPVAWSQQVLVPPVATWAHNAVVDMASDIVSWLPNGNFKYISQVHLKDWHKLPSNNGR